MKVTVTSICKRKRLARLLRPLLLEVDRWLAESLADAQLSHRRFSEISVWYSDLVVEGCTRCHWLKDSTIFSVEIGCSDIPDLRELKHNCLIGNEPFAKLLQSNLRLLFFCQTFFCHQRNPLSATNILG